MLSTACDSCQSWRQLVIAIKAGDSLWQLSKLATETENCRIFSHFLDFGRLFWTMSVIFDYFRYFMRVTTNSLSAEACGSLLSRGQGWAAVGESIQKQKNKPEIPRNDFHIFWQQGFDTKEYPKKLPIASQTLKFMEMTLILNKFIQTDIKA